MWIFHKLFQVDNFKFNLICHLIQVVANDTGSLSTAANFAQHGPTQPHVGIENAKNSNVSNFVARLQLSVLLCDGDLTVHVLFSSWP